MARIRTIKPEFFTSEDVTNLSPMARLLFIAMWCEADREGRLVWKPRTFKLRYLPADDCDVVALCDELLKGGLVVLYADGELAYIPTFGRHQHINPRESESVLPAPAPEKTKKARDRHASARVSDAQGGREGKGKEGEGREGDNPPSPLDCPESVDALVWADWLALRKAKKAPVTATVIASVTEEAAKAGMSLEAFLRLWCARGSQGLQADWLKPHERNTGPPRNDEPEWRREQRERMAAFAGPAAAKSRGEVIDLESINAPARIVG